MVTMASQITCVSIVYSTVCWGGEQSKQQSPVSLVIGELPSPRTSEAEKVSIWLRDHVSQVSEWRQLCQVTCTITLWSWMQIVGESCHRLRQCSTITLLSVVHILYLFIYPIFSRYAGHTVPELDIIDPIPTQRHMVIHFESRTPKDIHLPLAILLTTCAPCQYSEKTKWLWISCSLEALIAVSLWNLAWMRVIFQSHQTLQKPHLAASIHGMITWKDVLSDTEMVPWTTTVGINPEDPGWIH